MKISSIVLSESISAQLLKFPFLVDSLQRKDNDFLPDLEAWMRAIEDIYRRNNIAQVAEIAGLRSKILAPVFTDPVKRSTKKMQLQAAAELLYDLQSSVQSVLSVYEHKVNEARDIIAQLLAALRQSGTVKYQVNSDFQAFVNRIWSIFTSHEQLRPSAAKVLILVSQVDALRMIAEELNLEEWV